MSQTALAVEREATSGVATGSSDCLSGPKGSPPKGERWRYRVERGTKRHCWYTRGDTPRKTFARASQANEAAKAPDTTEPLQLSVANARAEADLSTLPKTSLAATPRDTLLDDAPDRQAWTLANRWSDHLDAPQPYQPPQMQVTMPSQNIQPEPPDDAEDSSSTTMLDIAAGAMAFIGLATMIIAFVIRRRRQDEPEASWHFAPRSMDGVRPRLPLAEADREPPPERRRTSLQTDAQRGNPIGRASLRTAKPDA